MNKKDIEKYIMLILNRDEVETINSIIVDNRSIKIYYKLKKDYAEENKLEFLNRIFEFNPSIQNLSHTIDYVNYKGEIE